MRRTNRKLPAVVAVVVASTLFGGCSTDVDEVALTELGALLRANADAVQQVGMPESVAEALPQSKEGTDHPSELSRANATDTLSAALLVVGKVTAVEPSAAFTFDDAGDVVQVDFGESQALWQYVVATVEVEEVVSSSLASEVGEKIRVLMPAPLGEDTELASRAYQALERAAFFLVRDTTVAEVPFRPLGSHGDWIFTLDQRGDPTDAPLATAPQRTPALLADVNAALKEAK